MRSREEKRKSVPTVKSSQVKSQVKSSQVNWTRAPVYRGAIGYMAQSPAAENTFHRRQLSAGAPLSPWIPPACSAPCGVRGGVYCAPGVSGAASAGRGSATGLRAGSACRRARSTGARGAADAVCASTRGAARGARETGYAATTRGDDTAARARAQRSDRYYRFTLLSRGGVCASSLHVNPCRRLTACVIAGCVSATPPSIAIAAPVLGGPEVVRARCVFHSSSSTGAPSVVGTF